MGQARQGLCSQLSPRRQRAAEKAGALSFPSLFPLALTLSSTKPKLT